MANVVRDPREHPDAIIPDLSQARPLLTFTKDDVAFVYGSRWKQRYFTQDRRRLFSAARAVGRHAQDLAALFRAEQHRLVGPLYPPDNFKRPTGPLCDGCHSVNYDIATKTVTEWNVGCERATAPAARMSRSPSRANILNPAAPRLRRANDTCIQCHSQGQPLKNPIEGKYYDWPVGFHVGLNLADFWELEEHKLGETTFHPLSRRHRAQEPHAGERFRQSLMYARGVTCFSCHDPHGTRTMPDLRSRAALCLDCHGPNRRTARTRHDRAAHASRSRQRRAANASPATCRRSQRRSAT